MGSSDDIRKAIKNGTLDIDEVMEAARRAQVTLDNPGFCTACGAEADGCEPDARNYKCENCGKSTVFGAEEIILCSV